MLLTDIPALALAMSLLLRSTSAFAPPSRRAQLIPSTTGSHLAASCVDCATPATEPEVFFQSRIVEPKDVESVPSAAYLLSKEFPDQPFVVQYRSTNIYDTQVERRPELDLSVLKQIKIGDNFLSVDVGVTIEALVTELSQLSGDSSGLKDIFSMLPANGCLTVAEAALEERFKKLRSIVEEVHVVDKDGTIQSKQLLDVDVSEDIIVTLVLTPPPKRSTEFVARWYTRKLGDKPIPEGFTSDLSEDVKVIVHKYGVFNDIPNIVVFVDGGRDLDLPKDEWNEILIKSPQELWYLQHELSEEGGFDVLTASEVLDTSQVNPSFEDIYEAFVSRDENLVMWFEKDQIRAAFDSNYPLSMNDAMVELFDLEKDEVSIAISAQDKPLLSGYSAAALPRVEKGTTIKGFNGEIFDGIRGQMHKKRLQYATSSYDNMMNPSMIVYPEDKESVVVAIKYATLPEFAEDRKTRANPSGRPYKVIGRGGGHQYCGTSCETNAFIISMENFDRKEWVTFEPKTVTGPDGQPQTITKEVHFGTGIKLKRFAEFMNTDPKTGWSARGSNSQKKYRNSFGATIPHGECPAVGIGGHSQTGGYGHIARSFGLAVDYLYEFTIVTANGEIRTVNRDSKDQADKDLYWAVLGGSPGAFGITTNLVFHPIYDKDYPHSTAYSTIFKYTDKRMRAVLDILEDFINRSQESDENAISEGLDLMTSLSSNVGNRVVDWLDQDKDNVLRLTPVDANGILFELVCKDTSDAKAKKQFDEIVEKFKKTVKPGVIGFFANKLVGTNGRSHYKLSELSLKFTRKAPGVTKSGRENRKPYRKLCYGSKDKLKPGWAKAYADLLKDVTQTKEDISCVFQVVVGGGAQTRLGKANLNSIAHRDAQLHGIIFDLFRGEDDASIMEADKFATKFEIDVVNKYQTAHPKVMVQWASHGDLDMNKESVWENYFDKPENYHKLRRIKKDVDPDDIFHSRFTIRPAQD